MRMMLRFTIPVEKGNEAVADGSIGRTFEALLEKLQPEAAYFFAEGGERAGLVVFETEDWTHAPEVLEPLFLNLDASVEVIPVLTADDLKASLARVTA